MPTPKINIPSKQPQKSKPTAAQLLADVLVPGQSIELLQALHIVTRGGGINQDSRRGNWDRHHELTCASSSSVD